MSSSKISPSSLATLMSEGDTSAVEQFIHHALKSDNNEDMIVTASCPTTLERTYLTMTQLTQELSSMWEDANGRLCLIDAAYQLGVEAGSDDVTTEETRFINDELHYVHQAAQNLLQTHDGRIVGTELITSSHLEALVEKVLIPELSNLHHRHGAVGKISVLDVSSDLFALPTDVTIEVIRSYISKQLQQQNQEEKQCLQLAQGDRLVLLLPTYYDFILPSILGELSACTLPLYLHDEWARQLSTTSSNTTSTMTRDAYWYEDTHHRANIFEKVQQACTQGRLPGYLRLPSGGMGGGTTLYVPHIYAVLRRKEMDDLLSHRGYITYEQLRDSYGVAPPLSSDGVDERKSMVTFMRSSFPDSVALPTCIVQPSQILSPLESMVEEAVSNGSFVDLTLFLPEDVLWSSSSHIQPTNDFENDNKDHTKEEDDNGQNYLSCPGDDVHVIMNRIILPRIQAASTTDDSEKDNKNPDSSNSSDKTTPKETSLSTTYNGLIIRSNSSEGYGLYITPDMIQHIFTTILPPLIETYGKERAKVIFDASMQKDSPGRKTRSTHHQDQEETTIVTSTTSKKGGKKGKKKNKNADPDPMETTAATSGITADAPSKRKLTAKEKRQAKKAAAAAAVGRKRSGSNAAEEAATTSAEGMQPGLIPLSRVVRKIAEAYPDLKELQEDVTGELISIEHNESDKQKNAETKEDTWNTIEEGGPLEQLARQAFYTSLAKSCLKAVQAEVLRLRASSQQGAIRARDAFYMRDVERTFEMKVYPRACHVVQMFAKLAKWAQTQEEDHKGKQDEVWWKSVKESLERDFLLSVGADFARRLTEYCLLKYEVEEDKYTWNFTKEEQESDKNKKDDELAGTLSDLSFLDKHSSSAGRTDLPPCCYLQSLASTRMGHPPSFLSCKQAQDMQQDEESSENKSFVEIDPLKILRDELPHPAGVALARMWVLCGGETFWGGTKRSIEDGSWFVRPGNFEGYLKHAEESCLSMCGLPFKVLDKKTEKQALFSRRQEMSAELTTSTSAGAILDLTVMLLFQQTKGIAVSGDALSSTLLDVLLKGKSIHPTVGEKLRVLATLVTETKSAKEDGEKEPETKAAIDNALLSCVKGCGLSRDISQHDIERSQGL